MGYSKSESDTKSAFMFSSSAHYILMILVPSLNMFEPPHKQISACLASIMLYNKPYLWPC